MGHTIAGWFDRDIVTVEGPDAARFLQGQISQDTESMPVGSSGWSLILNPAGKIVAWARVYRPAQEAFVIEVASGFAQDIVDRLNRFRIRVACEIEAGESRQLLSVRTTEGEIGADARAATLPDGVLAGVVAGSTAGVSGADFLMEDRTLAATMIADSGWVTDAAEFEAWRIGAGIPEMGSELHEAVIPAEIGQWFIDESVSFTKGCYVGQELVARVDSRGANTPFRLRGVRLSAPGAAAASVGDELTDADGKVLGTLTSVAGDVALARVARSVEPPTDLRVAGAVAHVVVVGGPVG